MFTSRSPGKGARGPLSLLKPSWVSLVLLCALLHRVAGQHADVSAVAATPEASAATADVAVAMAAKSSALAKSLTPQSVTLSIVLGGACPVSVDAAQQLLTPALINDLSRLTGLALQGPPNPVVTNLTDGTFVTKDKDKSNSGEKENEDEDEEAGGNKRSGPACRVDVAITLTSTQVDVGKRLLKQLRKGRLCRLCPSLCKRNQLLCGGLALGSRPLALTCRFKATSPRPPPPSPPPPSPPPPSPPPPSPPPPSPPPPSPPPLSPPPPPAVVDCLATWTWTSTSNAWGFTASDPRISSSGLQFSVFSDINNQLRLTAPNQHYVRGFVDKPAETSALARVSFSAGLPAGVASATLSVTCHPSDDLTIDTSTQWATTVQVTLTGPTTYTYTIPDVAGNRAARQVVCTVVLTSGEVLVNDLVMAVNLIGGCTAPPPPPPPPADCLATVTWSLDGSSLSGVRSNQQLDPSAGRSQNTDLINNAAKLVSGSSINFGVTKPPATSAAVGFSFTANLEAAGTGGSLIVSCAAFASDGTTAAIRTAIAQITNSAPQTFTYTLIANVANLASPGAYCDLFWSATGGAAVVVDDVVMTVNLIGSCPAP